MRLYTLEEAQALLPSVIPVLEEIRSVAGAVAKERAAVAEAGRASTGNGHLPSHPWQNDGSAEADHASLDRRLREAGQQVEAWGIELKDPDRGLIDFYWDREGEVVFLCYLLGEPEIGWWHRQDAGFAGRQKLP